MRMVQRGGLLIGLVIVFLTQAGGVCWSQTTERVSVDSTGVEATGNSNSPAISADGRYVAFESFAADLVANDTNGKVDIFVHDTQTDTTTRVSVDSAGNQANGDSNSPSMSSDGRYVAFQSYADNLVTDDTNGFPDIFVRDLQAATTTRVSVDSTGTEGTGVSFAPSISADGNEVAFESDAELVVDDLNGTYDIFVRDLQAATTLRVSVDSTGVEATGNSNSPAISADGRYVAFESFAANLVANDTNGKVDIFVHDTQTDTTTRVSVDSTGSQANGDSNSPAISADGRYVVFESDADDLVANDTNVSLDIFVHDLQAATTTRVSVESTGIEANANSRSSSLSPDGRHVTFHSDADNLVADDTNTSTDIFVHDRDVDENGIYDEPGKVSTVMVSVDSAGNQGNATSRYPCMSSASNYIAFESEADNLVANDTNGLFDIFSHEWQTANSSNVEGSGSGNSGCFISSAAAYFSVKETPPPSK